MSNIVIQGNSATDSADPIADDGGGLALYNTAKVTNPATVSIAGSTTAIQNNVAYDAGGGIAVRGAVSLTLTGISVTGNQTVGGGAQQGGGLFFAATNNPVSSLSAVHNCLISGNVAGANGSGEGGGIWTDQPLLINQGSVISGNDGEGAGGGIVTNLSPSGTGVVTITASTVTGNRTSASGNGGGIEVDSGSKANLNLSFNRIFGNSAGNVGAGLYNGGAGTLSAADNWWGCNGGPQTADDGCDQVAGAVSATTTVSPAIQLAFSASPNPILDLSSTTLTAAFQDSSSKFSSNLNGLTNLPVVFSNAVNGTIGSSSTVTGTSATATAAFTPNASPTAQANVQIDNAVLTATMQVSDFSLSSSSSAQVVNVGTESVTYPVAVTAINGFGNTITLSISNASGLNATLNSTSVVGSGSVTVTVQPPSAAPGLYSITITATSGNISHQLTVQLTLADFAVSISPSSQTLTLGGSAVYTVTVSTSTGFNGPITLSSSGLPAGTFSFNLSILNLSGSTTSASSTLTVTPTAIGNYSFSVTASSAQNNSQASVARSTSGTLVVNSPPSIAAPNVTLNVLIYPGPGGGVTVSGDTFGLQVSNSGSIAPISVSFAGANGFLPTNTCTAPALSSCTLSGEFAANASTPSGTYTATLVITGVVQPPLSGTVSTHVSASAKVTNSCIGNGHCQ